jgi:hypothetical protein
MFFKKGRGGGRCGCIYGTKGAGDRKTLGTPALYGRCPQLLYVELYVNKDNIMFRS